jgi:membrane-bound lytic murein transglycosylase D
MPKGVKTTALLLLTGLLAASCATSRYPRVPSHAQPWVKDKKPSIWSEDHPRVTVFRRQYASTSTVKTALLRSRSYLPYIVPEFRRRRLPLQLAYLPMIESMFDPRADSGHARGLWQFVPETAKIMGLRVGAMGDDRLNVRKSTRAAAEYLDQLGEMFNYNWALALAAYNCGPGCIRDAVQRQRSWDFWELRLRRETAEYVPRFLAMLQVAQDKYPELMVAELASPNNRRRLSQSPPEPPSGDSFREERPTADATAERAEPPAVRSGV